MNEKMTRREFLAVLAGGTYAVSRSTAIKPSSAAARSRVVTAYSPGDPRIDVDGLGRLLDRSITALTGASDPNDAWRFLFSPDDQVSIKVNCLGGPGMSTDPRLVDAIVERLIRCGLQKRRIIIWDRFSRELDEAGYTLSMGGSGIQCYGTDEAGYSRELYEHDSVASLFSRILTDRCNKVINVPILKHHGICGMTFAMKNHFGSINNPNKYHLNSCEPYIGHLNSMQVIRRREALIVGDMTKIQADGGPSHKSKWAVRYGRVLVGTDPVAVDRTALDILQDVRKSMGIPALEDSGQYPHYIEKAVDAGVGKPEQPELIDIPIRTG